MTGTLPAIEDVPGIVFAALRLIDAEAVTVRDGEPTGLEWYGGHVKPHKPKTEDLIVARLSRLLSDAGLYTQRQIAYPELPQNRRGRCDMVSRVRDGGSVWMEVKGAWKEYWRKQKKGEIYRSYLLYPLEPSSMPRNYSVALDIEKLKSLKARDAAYAALLLMGFDSMEHPMDDDIALLRRLSGLGSDPWEEHGDSWNDARRPGCRVRCFLWVRPVTDPDGAAAQTARQPEI